MTTPAIAPYVPTYANRVPYITPDEYKAAPTGVDVSQLVPGGAPAVQTAALTRQIARASSWADSLCFQVLAATTDTQAGVYLVKAGGLVQVPCDYSPIVYVTNVTTGWSPSQLSALPSLGDVWPNGKVVTIPVVQSQGSRLYVVVSYVNGYANTTLAMPANRLATTVTAASGLGIVPGLTMRLDNGTTPVYVTVDTSYTVGSTTVPLVDPLPDAFSMGVSFSALPEAIKQATISLTSALIKTRGTAALVISNFNSQPSETELTQAGGMEDFDVALDQLAPFIRAI